MELALRNGMRSPLHKQPSAPVFVVTNNEFILSCVKKLIASIRGFTFGGSAVALDDLYQQLESRETGIVILDDRLLTAHQEMKLQERNQEGRIPAILLLSSEPNKAHSSYLAHSGISAVLNKSELFEKLEEALGQVRKSNHPHKSADKISLDLPPQ
ncbi:MAG: hypothetical protein KDD36_00080 [Flavobacteriales bacterium]|nr:hypothetical protein [Flavobacteriales bacterium]